MPDIIGHKKIQQYFKKAIKAETLHHAYLFSGPEHVGKRTVADWLVGQVFDEPVDKLLQQPDFYLVKRLNDKKTGKLKKDISVDQIRDLKTFFSQKSLVKQHKVAIIDGAERLNILAANGLLKTLEEPRGASLIILITSTPEFLPRTILSRAHQIQFSQVTKPDMREFLASNEVSESKADLMIEYAHGLPGLLKIWQEDPEAFSWYCEEVQRLRDMVGKPFHEKLAAIEPLFGDKSDHTRQRALIFSVLGIWQSQLQELSISEEKVVELYDYLVQARAFINKNIHPRLLLEHFVLHLP